MKRELVDRYVYPAFPFGVPDTSRNPLPKYLAGNGPIKGQVRIVAHPAIFMKATYVRMYVYSADPTYHSMREAFQVRALPAACHRRAAHGCLAPRRVLPVEVPPHNAPRGRGVLRMWSQTDSNVRTHCEVQPLPLSHHFVGQWCLPQADGWREAFQRVPMD